MASKRIKARPILFKDDVSLDDGSLVQIPSITSRRDGEDITFGNPANLAANGTTGSPLLEEERDEALARMTYHFGAIFDILGYDWRRDTNMHGTPRRMAKWWLDEMLVGTFSEKPKVTDFENVLNYDELIKIPGIRIVSTCAHHGLPFMGYVFLGIFPGKGTRLLGLSKYARISQWYARRFQIQEDLTMQLSNEFQELLKPAGLGVTVSCRHTCCSLRGVGDTSMSMETSRMTGLLRRPSLKHEFVSHVNTQIEKLPSF